MGRAEAGDTGSLGRCADSAGSDWTRPSSHSACRSCDRSAGPIAASDTGMTVRGATRGLCPECTAASGGRYAVNRGCLEIFSHV